MKNRCRELQHLVMDKNCVRHLDGSGFALNNKLKIFRAQENGMKTFSNLDTMTVRGFFLFLVARTVLRVHRSILPHHPPTHGTWPVD